MSERYKIAASGSAYFLTATVTQWVDVFTRPVYKEIVIESLRFCQNKKGLRLHAFVVMSNHLHCIVSAKQGYNLSDILRDFKKFTAHSILKTIETGIESRRNWMLWIFKEGGRENHANENYQFWQPGNHAIELLDNAMIRQKLNYLHQNPVRAGWVAEPQEYLYSSAANYSGKKGILDVELLEV